MYERSQFAVVKVQSLGISIGSRLRACAHAHIGRFAPVPPTSGSASAAPIRTTAYARLTSFAGASLLLRPASASLRPVSSTSKSSWATCDA